MELDELIAHWQARMAAGEAISPEEACEDYPHLLDEFRRRVEKSITQELSTRDESKLPEKTPFRLPNSTGATKRYLFFQPSTVETDLGMLAGYRILDEIGRGGMGYVFLAEEQSLRRKVALKVMKPEIGPNPQARARFEREAHAAAQLNCDFITPIYRIGEENGILFIAMPLLRGRSLDDVLKDNEPIPIELVQQVARETAFGLAVAHGVGLFHRDIKPANLWLEECPTAPSGLRVKILDFGLARDSDEESLTESGALVGTPGYMSPEQINGDPLDGRTDLFSLGCVLYRLATGKRPFEAKTIHGVLVATQQSDPPLPQQLRSDLPEALSLLIDRLLSKEPSNRYQSATELIAAIRAADEMIPPATPHLATKLRLTSAASVAAAPQRPKNEATTSGDKQRRDDLAATKYATFNELLQQFADTNIPDERQEFIRKMREFSRSVNDPNLVFIVNHLVASLRLSGAESNAPKPQNDVIQDRLDVSNAFAKRFWLIILAGSVLLALVYFLTK